MKWRQVSSRKRSRHGNPVVLSRTFRLHFESGTCLYASVCRFKHRPTAQTRGVDTTIPPPRLGPGSTVMEASGSRAPTSPPRATAAHTADAPSRDPSSSSATGIVFPSPTPRFTPFVTWGPPSARSPGVFKPRRTPSAAAFVSFRGGPFCGSHGTHPGSVSGSPWPTMVWRTSPFPNTTPTT